MRYTPIPPPPHLAPYVRSFWTLESGQAYTHRNMADGCAEMVFHYQTVFDELLPNGHTETAAASAIQGPSQQYRRFTATKGFGIFGVYLYPFALNGLFNIPVTAISNQMPSVQEFLGAEGRWLEEQMMLARSNTQRINAVIQFLEKQLRKHHRPLHPVAGAVRQLIHTQAAGSLRNLSAQYCLSERQFERRFKELAGFSPKLYARIMRFQAATSQFSGKKQSLTQLAYQCGYYDQAHFIHDFKEFSGFTPSAYFSGITEATAWREEE
jgi:AraC-like DNA-binding protein